MPQNALEATVSQFGGTQKQLLVTSGGLAVVAMGVSSGGVATQPAVDSNNFLIVTFDEETTALNVSSAQSLKTGAGSIGSVNVVTVTSAAGVTALYDATAAAAVSASNLLANIPGTVGAYNLNHFPYKNGLVVSPGTGTVVAVAYR